MSGLPSIPSIPTIPMGIGGVIRVPNINIPNVPTIPTIPPLSGLSGLSGLKALGGAVPGLVGSGNLCGISIKQIDVFALTEVIKAALIGRLAGTTIAGVSGAALLAKLEQFRQISIDLVSFQAELQSLNVKDPVAVAAFLNRWKDKVPGGAGEYVKAISDALNKGLAFDYCSLVPNINIDPTSGAVKVLAKMAPTPGEAPPDSKPLIPTAVDNTTKTSYGNSKAAFNVNTEFLINVKKPWIAQVEAPLRKKIKASASKVVYASNELSGVNAKVKHYGRSAEELSEDGLLSDDEEAKLNAYNTAIANAATLNEVIPVFFSWFNYYCDVVAEVVSKEAYTEKREKIMSDAIPGSSEKYAELRTYLEKTESIIDGQKALVVKWVSYQDNKAHTSV